MTRAKSDKTYHHGDLRQALLAAAERLMGEQEGWTFTLREIARVAGVSHNAPYNHFADRRALLAAVAASAFDDLRAALLRELMSVDAADVPGGIRATGRAYVTFAVANPARYRLMFSADLAGCDDPAFKAAGDRASAVLRDLIARGVAAGSVRADPAGSHALAAWSLVHGLGTLILDGWIPRPADPALLVPLIDAVADALVGELVRRPA